MAVRVRRPRRYAVILSAGLKWQDISADSCHFEQAFSADGGKTSEVNWIATDTRVRSEPGA